MRDPKKLTIVNTASRQVERCWGLIPAKDGKRSDIVVTKAVIKRNGKGVFLGGESSTESINDLLKRNNPVTARKELQLAFKRLRRDRQTVIEIEIRSILQGGNRMIA
jgi:hypothetical protein